MYAQDQDLQKPQPIIVNGDAVEYSTDNKQVTAAGDVSVEYKDAVLTCKKLTVNTETKDAEATGDVKLVDAKGVIEAQNFKYNFQDKTGIGFDAKFRSNPYFGRAKEINKVSDAEFIAYKGYMTTCSYDLPHYRLKMKKVNYFPGDKMLAKRLIFNAGRHKPVPLMYLPALSKSLKDPFMHVQMMPGKDKQWGKFLLTAWKYQLTENVNGRIYLDYRTRLGIAEGFGTNYKTQNFGTGDFKYYYTQERTKELPQGDPAEFQRYFIRWKHKWQIDERTDFISQYYEITDSKRSVLGTEYNFLKDYFPREFEKDSLPLTYSELHHTFDYSSISLLLQKRVNRWYPAPQIEKLPEIRYTAPSIQVAQSPFYFLNESLLGNYNKKNTSTSTPAANDDNPDAHVNRLDTTNKFSLPMRVAFIQFTPFVSGRETFYDKGIGTEKVSPRMIFYSGANASTKFYRMFNLQSNWLKLDINGLRHIITPSAEYSFNHEPSVSNNHLRQIDGVDSLARSNSTSLSLSNKLQTKRENKSVDITNFIVTSNYAFKPKTGEKRGSSLSDILFDLELIPYAWLRFDADATYKHSGARDTINYHRFSDTNFDVNFTFSQERYIKLGHRYARKAGKEFTFDTEWRLNPKWKVGLYERYQFARLPLYKRGLRAQQYTVTRDLHCWEMELSYSVERGKGNTVWLVMRLKAFPELEFDLNRAYNTPKPGSQSLVP